MMNDHIYPSQVELEDRILYNYGLTLRDYIAIEAMKYINTQWRSMTTAAVKSYAMADAMLEARK